MLKCVFSCIGTRADIIKMSPILSELKADNRIITYTCLSGQHKELAFGAINDLSVEIDMSFDIMTECQSPSDVLSKAIINYTKVMQLVSPSLVLVHGDTTTALAGALAAVYMRIPIFYIEAGLRTYSDFPFPEELHRRIITHCSTFFSCQDRLSVRNLQSERVSYSKIFLTGSTLADVLFSTVRKDYQFKNTTLKEHQFERYKEVVVTLHRNELSEKSLANVCCSIKKVADRNSDVVFLWPVHLNPRIRNTVFRLLSSDKNIYLLDPIGVRDMHNLLFRCALVLTDSAGLQEEAYLLGKSTIILRDQTERPDFMDESKSKLVSPGDANIDIEIETVLKHIECGTDFSLANYIYTKTGASTKICNAIRDIVLGEKQ